MVDRYDGIIGMSGEGRFVRLIDYEALKAERDALAAQVEALKVDAERYQTAKKKKWLTRGEGSIDAAREQKQ